MKLRTRLKLRNSYPPKEKIFHIFHENLAVRWHLRWKMKKKLPVFSSFSHITSTASTQNTHQSCFPSSSSSWSLLLTHSFFLHAGRHVFLIKACSNNDFICAFAWKFECGKISARTISADSADTFDFISVPFNSHEEKILLWILDESTYKYWVNQWKV